MCENRKESGSRWDPKSPCLSSWELPPGLWFTQPIPASFGVCSPSGVTGTPPMPLCPLATDDLHTRGLAPVTPTCRVKVMKELRWGWGCKREHITLCGAGERWAADLSSLGDISAAVPQHDFRAVGTRSGFHWVD